MVCVSKPWTFCIKSSLFAMFCSAEQQKADGAFLLSGFFGSVLKKAGAEKRHTEEVPRRNAASPEWETDIHHHQTEGMTKN